jgi:hypothetical protein
MGRFKGKTPWSIPVGALMAASPDRILEKHKDHELEQVGRCIYCNDCGTRVCQGQLSKEYIAAHPHKPKREKPREYRPGSLLDLKTKELE